MTCARDKDVAWLESAQLEEFSKLGLSAPKPLNEDAFRTSSRYDHPFLQTLFGELANPLEEIMGWHKVPLERPLFGEWPGQGTNAFVLQIPGRQRYAILFQCGLLEYIRIAVGALLAAVPPEAFQNGALELSEVKWNDPSTVEHVYSKQRGMLEAISGALLGNYGKAQAIVQNLTNQPKDSLRQSVTPEGVAFPLLYQTYAFILAHEYGHILEDAGIFAFRTLGSFADDDQNRAFILNTLASLTSEMNADQMGAEAIIRLGRVSGIDVATSYLGAHLYFTLMHFLEASADVIVSGAHMPVSRSPLSTHPPLLERQKYCLNRILPEFQDSQEKEAIRDAVDGIQELCNMLWVGISYVLEQWHLEGAQTELLPHYQQRATATDISLRTKFT